ncbi:hypothetical protein L9F63_001377, partial [Diploptera punctata]
SSFDIISSHLIFKIRPQTSVYKVRNRRNLYKKETCKDGKKSPEQYDFILKRKIILKHILITVLMTTRIPLLMCDSGESLAFPCLLTLPVRDQYVMCLKHACKTLTLHEKIQACNLGTLYKKENCQDGNIFKEPSCSFIDRFYFYTEQRSKKDVP